MGIAQRLTNRLSLPLSHRLTNVPAALLGGGASFNPASISGLRSRLLDANTFTSPIDSKYYLADSSTTNTHLPRQGRCWLFDGTNDFAERNEASLRTTGDYAVSMWIKTDWSLADKGVIGCWGANVGWMIYFNSNTIRAYRNSSFVTANMTSYSSSWIHLAVVANGTSGLFYVNGSAITTSGSFSGSTQGQPAINFTVGSYQNASGFLVGSVRDARVYSVAKTAGEIAAIYNQSRTGSGTFDSTGLLAAYPCNEESGTTGYDISGNGNHLTLTNITQATFHAADTGVTANPNNAEGYRLSGSVYIPKRLSDSLAADGNALTVTGRAAYHGCAETPCVTGNGSSVNVNVGSAIIPATADFSISFMLLRSSATLGQTYLSQVSAPNVLHLYGDTGNLLLYIFDGTTVDTRNVSVPVGVLCLCTLSRVGNLWTISSTNLSSGATSSNSITRSFSVGQSNSFLLGRQDGSSSALASMSQLVCTTGGATTYFPLQDGPGSSNTNRDISYVKSDGTGGVVSSAIVNGTVSTIWGNRVPGNVEDWCVKYGGRIAANGAFIAGMLTGGNAADGSAKTLAAGKFGNPFSRLNLNPATAAELNGKNIQTAYEDLPCVTGNASNVYASLGALLAGVNDCSFSFWANIPAASAQTLISTSGSQSTNGFVIYSATTSTLQLYSYPSSVASGAVSFSAGAWNFIEVSRVGSSATLSVNGVASTPLTISGALTGVVQLFRNLTSQYSAALISDLRITVAGVTTYFPLSDGSGADLAWYKSDGTKGVISTALQGTLTNVWANKTDGSKVAATKYALRAIVTRETEFNRVASDGDDRFLIYDNALSGADLTNIEGYLV